MPKMTFPNPFNVQRRFRLIMLFMKGTMEKGIASDLDKLKEILES